MQSNYLCHWHRLVIVCCCLWASSVLGQATEPARRLSEEESIRFLKMVRNAPPAPQTPVKKQSKLRSSSPEFQALITYDQLTGTETRYPAARHLGSGRVQRVAPKQGAAIWDVTHGMLVKPFEDIGLTELRDQGNPSVNPNCGTPSPILFTHTFPFSTIYKLISRFNVGGEDHFYVCSASSFSEFQLLTAGHCVYNHDPDNDPSTDGSAFADEMWAYAGQTDYVNPFFGDEGDAEPADRPFSFAKSVQLYSTAAWIVLEDHDYDIGYITLDRRVGNHTGWMGRETGPESPLDYSGYPGELPFVPRFEVRQYFGFSATTYGLRTIEMCSEAYKGHSGGPVWRSESLSDLWVQGVISTKNLLTNQATAARLTSERLGEMQTIIASDGANRPPIARPDLSEYFFTASDERKDLLNNVVPRTGTVGVKYSVFNAGFAPTGEIQVDFFLSVDNFITNFDSYIGTQLLESLEPFSFHNPTTNLNVQNTAPGTYYLGWIMRGEVAEYSGDFPCMDEPCSNVAVIADEKLTIENQFPCSGDGFEIGSEDDNLENASPLFFFGHTTNHSICPEDDQDWKSFTLTAPSAVSIETSGQAGDTMLYLRDAAGSLLEVDNDSGSVLFSLIDRVCGVDELAAGTYYVQVTGSDPLGINSYQITIDGEICEMIFEDDFE